MLHTHEGHAGAVITDCLRGLHRLGVDDGGHCPGRPTHLAADALAELVADLSDDAGRGPAGHEPVTRAPGWEVVGQCPPLAAGVAMPLLELLKYCGRKGDDLFRNLPCASPDVVFLAHDVLRDRMAGVAVRCA